MIRKEIKDFLGSNTVKQFEEKLINKLNSDFKRSKLEGNIKDLIINSFREFYTIMYQQRNFWESKFKNS
jgi:hypothetical protein